MGCMQGSADSTNHQSNEVEYDDEEKEQQPIARDVDNPELELPQAGKEDKEWAKVNIFVENTMKQKKTVRGYIDIIAKDISWTLVPAPIIELCFKYQFSKERNERLVFVGEIMLDGSWDMSRVKQVIGETFTDSVPKKMRLREFSFDSILERVYLDDRTLQQNCKRIQGGMSNGVQMCCEQIECDEHLTKHWMVINAAKCEFTARDVLIRHFDCITMHKQHAPLQDFKSAMRNIASLNWNNLSFYFMKPTLFYSLNSDGNAHGRKMMLLRPAAWTSARNYRKHCSSTRTGDILLYTVEPGKMERFSRIWNNLIFHSAQVMRDGVVVDITDMTELAAYN